LNGEVGNAGDKHYKCLYGSMKVLTIMKKMKYSLNSECSVAQIGICSLLLVGLISNLRAISAPMYCLYLVMKERSPNQISVKEIAVASRKKVLDPGAASEFVRKLESANMTIQSAFEKQVEAAAVHLLFFQPTTTLTPQRDRGIKKSSRTYW
jgi:hypothetical protein